MHSCKISVVIPVYNMEKTIARAIKSFIVQKYENKELIVLDGGSTDKTLEEIEKYKEFINFFVSQKDGGSSAAIASNMKHISGDYVAVLGADDWYEEDALEAMAEAYHAYHADVFYGDYNEHLPDGQVVKKSAAKVELDMVYYQCPFNTNAAFVKRNLLDLYYTNYWINHKDELDMASDHYLWLVLYHDHYKFSYIPSRNPIVNFSMSGRSNMNTKKLCEQNRNVLDYVLPKNDASYPRRAKICDLYCATRMLAYYSEKVGKEIFQRTLKKYIHGSEVYVIFGAGHMGQEAYKVLSMIDISPKYFVDNYATTNNGCYREIMIHSPEILRDERNLTVILASVGYEDEMEKQLLDMNLSRSIKIIRYTDICSGVIQNCLG